MLFSGKRPPDLQWPLGGEDAAIMATRGISGVGRCRDLGGSMI